MSAALVYRANGRRRIGAAFACAAAIHLGAIAWGQNRSSDSVVWAGDDHDIVGIDVSSDQSPAEQPTEIKVPDQANPVQDEDAFSAEVSTPPPTWRFKPEISRPTSPSSRKTNSLTAHRGFTRALVAYGPRPAYPYEARRLHITGSGIAALTVDSATGKVVDVRMRQSTGSPVLDKATIGGLLRWRFKPIQVRTIDVPITYTLSGAAY